MKKSLWQKKHFQQRCFDRFGTSIGKKGRKKIISDIQSGKAKCIKKQSLRVSVFEVEHNGNKMRVVYDKQRKNLVTALVVRNKPKKDGLKTITKSMTTGKPEKEEL
tara:strand:+ start:58605 stop:58922 length:318 start_codon:yes stop_codon:yes gene_type:complete